MQTCINEGIDHYNNLTELKSVWGRDSNCMISLRNYFNSRNLCPLDYTAINTAQFLDIFGHKCIGLCMFFFHMVCLGRGEGDGLVMGGWRVGEGETPRSCS